MRFQPVFEFVKPVLIGAAILGGVTFVRICVGILAGYRAKTENEATDAIALASLGGALSGLMYALIGRRLRTYGAIGNYVAGVVTAAPYIVFLVLVLGKTDPDNKMPLNDPWTWGLIVFASVLASVFLGREFHEKDFVFKSD